MNSNIIKDDSGIYHVIKNRQFHYYIAICGKLIHDDTEPRPYESICINKHTVCPDCHVLAKIAKVHN